MAFDCVMKKIFTQPWKPNVNNVYLNKQLQVINENLVSLTKHNKHSDEQRCVNVSVIYDTGFKLRV